MTPENEGVDVVVLYIEDTGSRIHPLSEEVGRVLSE